jgi:hypothetical protein
LRRRIADGTEGAAERRCVVVSAAEIALRIRNAAGCASQSPVACYFRKLGIVNGVAHGR